MEAISTTVKITLPKYLKSLPIPKSIDGIAKLSGNDVLRLVPFFLMVAVIVYALIKLILPAKRPAPPIVNPEIKKDNPKVVNMVDIEDIAKDKVAYCRCWRSKKFPLCDGAHNKHNELTGDNVGPLVLTRPQPDSD